MDKHRVEKYEAALRRMLERLRGDTLALQEETRATTGGDAGGELSNVPMHLGDLGTETYMQELNSALLESGSQLREEVLAALGRIEQGTYGQCEECGRKIAESRLDAVPFTRLCTKCAQRVEWEEARPIAGRTEEEAVGAFTRDKLDVEEESDMGPDSEEILFTDMAADREQEPQDTHAAGTPGGGSAIGGLAGTNIGSGEPEDVDLEDAMGSGSFDAEFSEEDEELGPFSGPAGGAVGGTPAGKRAVGGKSAKKG